MALDTNEITVIPLTLCRVDLIHTPLLSIPSNEGLSPHLCPLLQYRNREPEGEILEVVVNFLPLIPVLLKLD